MNALKTVTAMRYVTPLREGGSLPAILDTEDAAGQSAQYVTKFVGAGQGAKALVAELLGGEIARALGLRVPQLAFVEMDAAIARSEPHEEIRDLLNASVGLNLGLCYLSGALAYSRLAEPPPDARLASQIVWLDAYLTNVDRTARNVNMLLWHDELWLIDHGASLYFHYSWDNYLERAASRFPMIRDHVLLPLASELPAVDAEFRERLTPAILRDIVALVPDIWLGDEAQFESIDAHRAGYVAYLSQRLASSAGFVEEAVNARTQLG